MEMPLIRRVLSLMIGFALGCYGLAVLTARRDAHDSARATLQIGLAVLKQQTLSRLFDRPHTFGRLLDATLPATLPAPRHEWTRLTVVQAALRESPQYLAIVVVDSQGQLMAALTHRLIAVRTPSAPDLMPLDPDPLPIAIPATWPPSPLCAMTTFVTWQSTLYRRTTVRLTQGFADVYFAPEAMLTDLTAATRLPVNLYTTFGGWMAGTLPAAAHSPVRAMAWKEARQGWHGIVILPIRVGGVRYWTASLPLSFGNAGVLTIFAPVPDVPVRWRRLGGMLLLMGIVCGAWIVRSLQQACAAIRAGFLALTHAAMTGQPSEVSHIGTPEFASAMRAVLRAQREAAERTQAAYQTAATAAAAEALAEAERGYVMQALAFLREGIAIIDAREILVANPAVRCLIDRDDVVTGMPVSVLGQAITHAAARAQHADAPVEEVLELPHTTVRLTTVNFVWHDRPAQILLLAPVTAEKK